MILIELIYNLSILVALSVLSGFIDTRYNRKKITGKVLQGLLFGAVVIIGMINPFVLTEGIIFDGRTIVISLCTFFFGPISGIVSSLIGIMYRIYIGGGGLLMGVLTIAEAFIFGYLFYYLRNKGKIRLKKRNLYLLGFTVHLMMLILMFTLPSKHIFESFSVLTLTVIGIYPIITIIIGKVLSDQEENIMFVETIKESEEKYRSITENSYNLIALLDLNWKYIYCNNTHKDLLGYDTEEFYGKKISDFFHPDESIDGMRFLDKCKNNENQTDSIPIKILCKDGGYKLLNYRIKALENEYNETDKILLIAQDITQQKKAEEDLVIAKEKAESSDRLKTAFLQNMSHEIRTPLNGILGFAGLLHTEETSKEEIVKYSGIIQNSGNRLLELINDIIEISRIETGNVNVYLKSISMHSILQNVINQFILKSEERGIELRLLKCENILFVTDEKMLSQILTNLINNAFKFTNQGNIEINYTLQNDEILFSVKDTGVGIPEEHQDKVFSRFYQVDMSMSRGFEGTGLGLSICKGLVETLKGRIWLKSEPGTGTTFYFTIPIIKAEDIMPEGNQTEETTIKGNRVILIAEDDEMSYEYLSIILNSQNFEILRASDGKSAVDICMERNDIDVVLMDIKLPIMNGLQATKLIKEINPKLPIIAQTAYAFSTEKEVALNAGCDDYLTKPVEKDDLLKVLSKYI
ncbi:MAG: ATP-binding protein [Candidatus Kapaibacterium sp.]